MAAEKKPRAAKAKAETKTTKTTATKTVACDQAEDRPCPQAEGGGGHG